MRSRFDFYAVERVRPEPELEPDFERPSAYIFSGLILSLCTPQKILGVFYWTELLEHYLHCTYTSVTRRSRTVLQVANNIAVDRVHSFPRPTRRS